MQNPIKALREDRKLGRTEFAMLLGRSYQQVAAVELGHVRTIPGTWHAPLEAAGFDFDRLSSDYQAWRASRMALQA